MPRLLPDPEKVPTPLLVDFHAENNPDVDYAVLVPYGSSSPVAPSQCSNTTIRSESDLIMHVTWRSFASAVHRGAHLLNPLNEAGLPSKGRSIIATLVVTDTIVYQTTLISILRSGAIPFPISPRNTPEAIVNLLLKTGCHDLVVSQGSALSALVDHTKALLDEHDHLLRVESIPSFHQLYPEFDSSATKESSPVETYPIPFGVDCLDATRIYFHSSGTTSLPKPIPMNERYFRFTCYHSTVSREIANIRLIDVAALPPFHVAGWFLQQSIPLGTGNTIMLWAPTGGPLPIPNPDDTLQAALLSNVSAIWVVPSFLVAWRHRPEAVEFLKTLDVVVTGSAPLPDEVGDFLTSQGVKLALAYGGTEFGICSTLACSTRRPEDWSWFSFEPKVDCRFIRQDDSPNSLYELQVWKNDAFSPSLLNLKDNNGHSGYSTKDLFQRHPTANGLFKLIGRLDDQITLVSGEKINPTSIEGSLLENPAIKAAVLFGRERVHVVLLVQPTASFDFPSDGSARSRYIDMIWPSVEAANRSSYSFARIFKEAIIITDSARPLPLTPKGSIQRGKAAALYSYDIESTYEIIATGKTVVELDDKQESEAFTAPLSWDVDSLTQWLIDVTEELLHHPIDPNEDLFSQGADSLTSTILRNRIMSAHEASSDEQTSDYSSSESSHIEIIPSNVVFSHPTIQSLAAHLASLRDSSSAASSITLHSPVESVSDNVDSLIQKYSYLYASPASTSPSRETVLITGTTGSLGSYLLAGLVADPRVERVWALNRGGDIDERQREAFASKDLNISGVISAECENGKVRFVSVDLADPNLGLPDGVYNQLAATTTVMIHNAWRLDFNLSLLSFEPNIRGTRHLLDLALASPLSTPPRFVFASSISSAASWNDPFSSIPEEALNDPSVCVGTGYGQSKYVSEKIVEAASRQTGLRTTNIRIGQLCGGPNGFWSTTDWFPILLKSSMSLGCLPDALGVVSWLPLHHAATSILEATLDSKLPTEQTLHLQHLNPISWNSVVSSVSRIIGQEAEPLPLVPISQWLALLESHDIVKDVERLPALKLLPFFRAAAALDEQLRARDSNASKAVVIEAVTDISEGEEADEERPRTSRHVRRRSRSTEVDVDGETHVDVVDEEPSVAAKPEALFGLTLSTAKMRDSSTTLRNLPSLDEEDMGRWISYWRSTGFIA